MSGGKPDHTQLLATLLLSHSNSGVPEIDTGKLL